MKIFRRLLLSEWQLGRAPFLSDVVGYVSPTTLPISMWNVNIVFSSYLTFIFVDSFYILQNMLMFKNVFLYPVIVLLNLEIGSVIFYFTSLCALLCIFVYIFIILCFVMPSAL